MIGLSFLQSSQCNLLQQCKLRHFLWIHRFFLHDLRFQARNMHPVKLFKKKDFVLQVGEESHVSKSYCRDHCPAPFSYSVRQKGYFHPFPLL